MSYIKKPIIDMGRIISNCSGVIVVSGEEQKHKAVEIAYEKDI